MNKQKVYIYPSLGGSFSMNRYLKGVLEGLKENNLAYEVVIPQGKGLFAKYLTYVLLAIKNRQASGIHLILSERYAYLVPFVGASTIVICHDLHTLYPEAGTPALHRLLYKFFLNSMFRSKKIVCVSEHTRSDLFKYKERFKFHPKVEVVHNGIEAHWLNSRPITLENDWTAQLVNKRVLLSVGTDAWYKNNQWSIKLLSRLGPEFCLLRVGDFNFDNQTLIKALSLSDRIVQVHSISDAELKFCYQNAELLLFPSFTEGYGWPALEAALCGCPVVSNSSGATREIFENNEGLIPLEGVIGFLKDGAVLKAKPSYRTWNDQVKVLLA